MVDSSMSWIRRSRFLGAMRYHRAWLGRLTGWVLLVLALGNAAMLALAAMGVGRMRVSGVTAELGSAIGLALVCACIASHSRTRFLLRFGTPRFSVWLSNLLAIFAAGAAFLIGTLLLRLAVGGAVLALSGVMPKHFGLIAYQTDMPAGAALLGAWLGEALKRLPMQLLWLLEASCLLYLLGCCLRRSRAVTLAVLLGGPFVAFMLLLVPAVNETVAAIEAASEQEIMVMGLQWMQWLSRTVHFVTEQWQWIQLGAAVVSLPLSYWCMRSTPQP